MNCCFTLLFCLAFSSGVFYKCICVFSWYFAEPWGWTPKYIAILFETWSFRFYSIPARNTCFDCIQHVCNYMTCVSVEVEKHVLNTSQNIVISVTYWLLNTHVRIFVDKMNILVDTIMNEHKLCYLLGYYNLNILRYDTHDTITEFIGILYSHTIMPLINCPTRVAHKLW